MTVTPAPTDNPDRTTVGRVELLSNVSMSLTGSLHNILVTNLSSVFLDFENITQDILERECGSFPEDNGSLDFECWRLQMSTTTDVSFLGIDFQAVLYQNQDLSPPSVSFVNNFNSSVDYMRSNATQAVEFIDSIPAELRVNVDNCSLPLNQILLSTVAPTTSVSIDLTTVTESTDPTEYVMNSSTRLTTSAGSTSSTGSTSLIGITTSTESGLNSPTSTLLPSITVRAGGSANQTGFGIRLILLPVVILIVILI